MARTDEEYDKLHTELRNEIGARHGLDADTTSMIPLTYPDTMRGHAVKLAKLLGTDTAPTENDQKGKDGAGKSGGLTAEKLHKRLDVVLGAHYKGPTKR